MINAQDVGARAHSVHREGLGILHTWSRTLIFHPHVHYLIPGGGLSPNQRQWVASRPKFSSQKGLPPMLLAEGNLAWFVAIRRAQARNQSYRELDPPTGRV